MLTLSRNCLYHIKLFPFISINECCYWLCNSIFDSKYYMFKYSISGVSQQIWNPYYRNLDDLDEGTFCKFDLSLVSHWS